MTSGSQKEATFRLDVVVHLGHFLGEEDFLSSLQRLLVERAPRWCERLVVQRDTRTKSPIDAGAPGSLAAALLTLGTQRGPFYEEMVKQFGSSGRERVFGSAELRGASGALLLVVSFDEQVVRRSGNKWTWGNSVEFQILRPRVDGVDSVRWAAELMEAVCSAWSPVHGRAGLGAEYDSKNMSHKGGATMAVGVDASKGLPGLYWLNFLGPPYRDLMGRERLLAAPAHRVKEVDSGILLSLGSNPRSWNSTEYREVEQKVLDHLGRQFFFSKESPDRDTVAPDFVFERVH
jgi:hypothetical protein